MQYLAGYDAAALAQMIQTTTVTSEEDNDQLSSVCTRFYEDNFQRCLEFPDQNRFIIAVPLICGHFSNTTNDICPEQCNLSDHLLPKHCGPMNAQVISRKKREKAPKRREFEKPGD